VDLSVNKKVKKIETKEFKRNKINNIKCLVLIEKKSYGKENNWQSRRGTLKNKFKIPFRTDTRCEINTGNDRSIEC